MELNSPQTVSGTNERRRSIGPERFISKLRGAVAANPIACYCLHAKIHFLVKNGEQCTGAQAAAHSRVIERTCSASHRGSGNRAVHNGWDCRSRHVCRVRPGDCAWEDAIAECADDSEQFVMANSRISSGLDDDVRSFIHGITGGIKGVEQTARLPWRVDEEILGGGYCSERC